MITVSDEKTDDESTNAITQTISCIDIQRYSSLEKAIRVTAYVMRFIQNIRNSKDKRSIGFISVEERCKALKVLIMTVQQETFKDEIESLNSSSQKKVPLVRQLKLYTDKNGLLRCTGRIQNAPVKESTKYPLLLPTHHSLTSLIVMDAHSVIDGSDDDVDRSLNLSNLLLLIITTGLGSASFQDCSCFCIYSFCSFIAMRNLSTSSPRAFKSSAEFKQRLPMGFVGCIKTFHVKNKLRTHLYDLSYPQVSDHIMSGLDIAECGSNSCNSLPCKYGGTCLAKDSDVYSCVCKHGFTGRDCEIVLDPCVMANCHESSTCQIYGNSYKCICSSNREGEFCEFEKLQPIDVPEFSGNSFLELPLGDIGSTAMTFTIWFKTSKPNGVLFYASTYAGGNGDFISLNIVDRRVEFRFNMGSGTIVISSDAVITLDTWHEVMIDKTKKFGILLIDKNPQYNYTGESKGFLTELNLDNSILYLGGFKSRFDIPVDSNITYNLTGVIQRMYINGKLYDDLMLSAKDKINVLPYRGAPCNVNPCLNGGVCIPKMDQVECKCPAKFIGVKCEKRVDSVNRDRPLLFDGETYLQYSNEISEESAAQRSNKYFIKFRTLKSNGLILYQNGKSNVLGDYLAIAIVRGRVEFSYNLGKQSEKDLHIIRSSVDIDDGGWHKILAERHEREGTLKVDNEKLITDSSTEGASQLDTNGILLIGGKTRVNIELPEDYNQGFMGCIQQVLVNDRELHLVQHRRTSSAVNFCDAR
ncbi:agrin [Mytilus galloprovincialis]|uniref:Agrin n=1 Tax=Mytilus galloprovincialis TaxID=29158 RepID=A0A8B6GPL6_MYTGA|nr:agrin [Mytilus galloprovincialis]